MRREHGQGRGWSEQEYREADENKKLFLNFRGISHTMRQLYEGRGSQKRVLILIRKAGGAITQRELTDRLGIQPGSASELISKLEKAGLIIRTVNETDRRTVDIVLSKTGRAAAERAAADREERHVQMFSCLTDEEKKTLIGLLEKLNADWRERYGAGGHRHGRDQSEQ